MTELMLALDEKHSCKCCVLHEGIVRNDKTIEPDTMICGRLRSWGNKVTVTSAITCNHFTNDLKY